MYARYFRHFYLGAKGLVIDTTEGREAYGSTCDFHFAPVLERDPALPEGVADGGIRVRGSGICYLGSAFATDGITGDFTVEDGATLHLRATETAEVRRFFATITPSVTTFARPVEVRKSKYLLFHVGLKLKKSVRLECEPLMPPAKVVAQLFR